MEKFGGFDILSVIWRSHPGSQMKRIAKIMKNDWFCESNEGEGANEGKNRQNVGEKGRKNGKMEPEDMIKRGNEEENRGKNGFDSRIQMKTNGKHRLDR